MPKTILIIEDEKSIREPLSRLFMREGFTVITAEGIEEARKLILDVDIVLSDIRLGDGNGLDFLSEIRKKGIKKPTLLMSGHLIGSETEKALELTGHPVLRKPMAFREVFEIVERILAEKD